MTDLTTPKRPPFTNCGECGAAVRNTDEYKNKHVEFHIAIDGLLDLNETIPELRAKDRTLGNEIDGLRRELRTGTPEADTVDLFDNDTTWSEPATEEDTDTGTPFAELETATTDLADLHDITTATTDPDSEEPEDELDEADDLDARIANLTSPVNVHTQPGI